MGTHFWKILDVKSMPTLLALFSLGLLVRSAFRDLARHCNCSTIMLLLFLTLRKPDGQLSLDENLMLSPVNMKYSFSEYNASL